MTTLSQPDNSYFYIHHAGATAPMDYAPYTYESISEAVSRRRPLQRRSESDGGDHRPISSSSNPTENHGSSAPSSSSKPPPSASSSRALKRSLTLKDLIFYGVGCSVGAGIYSLVGIGAKLAGPAISLSFWVCGIACCFTSLAYAEFAARVPLAGSAYTFAYVSFGELCGWLVGWNLTLGYAVSAAVVARSWAEYVVGFISGLLSDSDVDGQSNLATILHWSIHAPVPFFSTSSGDTDLKHDDIYECCPLAILIIAICTLVLVTGAKESSRFNTAMTILNLSILGFVVLVGVGSGSVHASDNWVPFFPQGIKGVGRAAGLVFFSYLGFDMVSCLSEEVQNPERNMPIGIIGSLMTSMTIYVTVSLVVVGMATIDVLGESTPIVNALLSNGCCTNEQMQELGEDAQQCLSYSCQPILNNVLYTGSRVVSAGAMFGLTTATFACLMGQPRIFYSMAVDGLLFKVYAKISPRTGVPTIGTVLTGIVTALVACFIDLESLANVISLGTLMVFTFVNAGVIILRTTPPVMNRDDDDQENTTTIASKDEEESLLLAEAASLAASFSRTAPHERSPLVQNAEAAILARSLGLIKKSSREIRAELKLHFAAPPSLGVHATTMDVDNGGMAPRALEALRLKQNGAWPQWLTLTFTILAIVVSVGLNHGWSTLILLVFMVLLVASALALMRLPQASPPETFTCPCVPLVPLLGMLCNGYMMGSMPFTTWSAISIWLFVGLLFYFSYGMHYSELRRSKRAGSSTNNRKGER